MCSSKFAEWNSQGLSSAPFSSGVFTCPMTARSHQVV
jgi:hypothetical protein